MRDGVAAAAAWQGAGLAAAAMSHEIRGGGRVGLYSIFGVDEYPEAGLEWRFHWGKTAIEVEAFLYAYTETALGRGRCLLILGWNQRPQHQPEPGRDEHALAERLGVEVPAKDGQHQKDSEEVDLAQYGLGPTR